MLDYKVKHKQLLFWFSGKNAYAHLIQFNPSSVHFENTAAIPLHGSQR